MKIEWKKITLEDKMLLEPYYQYEQSSSCEVSFVNNLLWAPFYEVEYAIVEEMAVFLSKRNGYSVSMPMAKSQKITLHMESQLMYLCITTCMNVQEQSIGIEHGAMNSVLTQVTTHMTNMPTI